MHSLFDDGFPLTDQHRNPAELLHCIYRYRTSSANIMSSYTKPPPKFGLAFKNPTYQLASSCHEMPVVAYGTFRSQPGEVGPAVIEAIKAGYRHFDVAHV